MRVAIAALVLKVSSTAASIFETLLPNETPSITKDPWTCTTEILRRFFDPPLPTGSLRSAFRSCRHSYLDECTSRGLDRPDGLGMPMCPFPGQSTLCAISTAMPSSLLPEYSSYISVASTWWAANKDEAVRLAEYCPSRWYSAMMAMPAGRERLNSTIALAGCYEAARQIEATVTEASTLTLKTATEGAASGRLQLMTVPTAAPSGVGRRAAGENIP
ncbi:hypothetical protein XA68_12329 [Ophiocordyceps unilateralis]|uniref:DUF7735 domain-containing protein n=1 Tax=Ophiocordyceps unilateralis TaxID=268505 RepID=A0A2A9PPC3_OPHUN|nr:hypothetical protein XA68_12329 [Ophiocordyceps unilateralis]